MSRRKRTREYLEDYFGLRRFERYGLALVLLLCFIFLLLRISLKSIDYSEPADLKKFSESIHSEKRDHNEKDFKRDDETGLRLVPFNPNTVSKEMLFDMGIPPSAVKSIINYRASGFKYKRPEDLLKCYGVDKALFDQLAPYVVMVDDPKVDYNNKRNQASKSEEVEIRPFPFDPNKVSRAEFEAMNLPDRFMDGFFNFRDSGARFYNVGDFEKVYSLTSELKSALIPFLVFPQRGYKKEPIKETELKPVVIQRFRFDPNRISQDSLILLGVPSSVASIWVNYRNSGRIFYQAEDLGSIYGLTPSTLTELSELMIFPKRAVYKPKPSTTFTLPSLEIDPNKASLEDLMEIKGIGRFYANQMLWRRKQLGGYYAIDQIGESDNLPDSTFQAIRYHFVPPTLDSLRMINVNTTPRRPFADHPYITYDRVNRIITHREFVGRIESMEYLLKLGLLSQEEAKRLGPYLSFD